MNSYFELERASGRARNGSGMCLHSPDSSHAMSFGALAELRRTTLEFPMLVPPGRSTPYGVSSRLHTSHLCKTKHFAAPNSLALLIESAPVRILSPGTTGKWMIR